MDICTGPGTGSSEDRDQLVGGHDTFAEFRRDAAGMKEMSEVLYGDLGGRDKGFILRARFRTTLHREGS
jgi:hypothetical protein